MPSPRLMDRLRDPSEKALAVLLLAPAFVLLLLIVVYPIGRLLVNSFFDLRLSGGQGAKFVGWDNYVLVLDDKDFWNAAKNTVLITFITVPGALVCGLGLAMLANLPFKRRWPVRLALLLPWALPLSFAGLIFAWFFHTEYAWSTMCFGAWASLNRRCGCCGRTGPSPRFARPSFGKPAASWR